MRARIAPGDAGAFEWIIVSRWGVQARYLSLARTFRAALAGQGAPLDLAPVWTVIARKLFLPPARHECFLLQARPPARVGMAGAFTPAEGHIRLSGAQHSLRVFAEGRYPAQAGAAAWRLAASRKPWMGEYWE